MLDLGGSPIIVLQLQEKIVYSIGSRTRSDLFHHHVALAKIGFECNCEANRFRPGCHCRHYMVTTMKPPQFTDWSLALDVLKNEDVAAINTWGWIHCVGDYRPEQIYCHHCPMYPDVCNIKRIHYKRNKLPMVWTLWGLLRSRERAKARAVLRKMIEIAGERLKRVK